MGESDCRERPLLAGGDKAARLAALLSVRAPLYEEADFILDTDGLSAEETALSVLRALRASP
jgi:shikimate kinase